MMNLGVGYQKLWVTLERLKQNLILQSPLRKLEDIRKDNLLLFRLYLVLAWVDIWWLEDLRDLLISLIPRWGISRLMRHSSLLDYV